MMKTVGTAALLGAILANAAPTKDVSARDVDTRFPYTGPDVPVADWVDPDPNGNGKGFIRLVEPPAVKPSSSKPSNNINVINTAFVPGGINIHYQTPFGLGKAPTVKYGPKHNDLCYTAHGASTTYGRTPSCSAIKDVTQCSEFFHNVQITGLKAGTTYYYQIAGANGTTPSQVLSFKTARPAGDHKPLTIAVLNDMGYTNAKGTYKYLNEAVDNDGVEFAWHGGDISYADDWYDGILPCEADWVRSVQLGYWSGILILMPIRRTCAITAPLPAFPTHLLRLCRKSTSLRFRQVKCRTKAARRVATCQSSTSPTGISGRPG